MYRIRNWGKTVVVLLLLNLTSNHFFYAAKQIFSLCGNSPGRRYWGLQSSIVQQLHINRYAVHILFSAGSGVLMLLRLPRASKVLQSLQHWGLRNSTVGVPSVRHRLSGGKLYLYDREHERVLPSLAFTGYYGTLNTS